MPPLSPLYDNPETREIIRDTIYQTFLDSPELRSISQDFTNNTNGLGDRTAAEIFFALFLVLENKRLEIVNKAFASPRD